MFRRILSDILFGIGVLWQIFVFLGVFLREITLEDIAIGALCSFATVGILYISLKIRTPRPVKEMASDSIRHSDDVQ